MTRTLWYRLALVGGLGLAALVLGFRPLFVAFYAGVAALAIAPLWARLQVAGVSAEIVPSERHPQAGEPLTVEVALTERGGRPRWGLLASIADSAELAVRWDAHRTEVNLPLRGARWWSVDLASRRRGLNRVGPVLLEGADPFGLYRLQRRVGTAADILVYPRTVPLADGLLRNIGDGLEGDVSPSRSHGVSSVAQLREYATSDPFTHIHWPTSARLGQLMTVDREDDAAERDVWIFLDLDRSVQRGVGEASTEEYAVTITASLAIGFLDADMAVGLIAEGNVPIELLPDRGRKHREHLLEALAVVHARGRTPIQSVVGAFSNRMGVASRAVVVTPSPEGGGIAQALSLGGTGVTLIRLDGPSFDQAAGSSAPGRVERSQPGSIKCGENLEIALADAVRGWPAALVSR